jgi:hypothetical protein
MLVGGVGDEASDRETKLTVQEQQQQQQPRPRAFDNYSTQPTTTRNK